MISGLCCESRGLRELIGKIGKVRWIEVESLAFTFEIASIMRIYVRVGNLILEMDP